MITQRKQFRLPDVGEGLTEADIVTWRVKPGDQVQLNQIIVDIETAKAVVELPSPYEGVVTGLLADEGQTVDVGTPIIEVEVAAEGAGAALASPALDPAAIAAAGPRPSAEDLVPPLPPPAEERQAVLVGYGVKASATTRRPRRTSGPAGGHPQPPVPAAGRGPAGPPVPAKARNEHPAGVLAKPPVRKLARELGVDLAGLAGSGPGGSITRDDVQHAASAPITPAAPAAPARRARRREAARNGSRSGACASTWRRRRRRVPSPHRTSPSFCRSTSAPRWTRWAGCGELPDFAGARVSPLLLVAKALLVAVARHPLINSTWDEDAQEIVVKHYVNLGIAVATERGLIVPTVKDAHTLSLPGLAQALTSLTETARAGKASPADLTGGTITITNVGVFGVDAGTPILTPPEAAILAFGQIREAPWVVDGQLAVRQVTTLSLSFDHRIVDGELGSAVLRDLGEMLRDPLRMLAWS